MKVATLILNRNLPLITDKLFNKIKKKIKLKMIYLLSNLVLIKINYQKIIPGGQIGVEQKKMA